MFEHELCGILTAICSQLLSYVGFFLIDQHFLPSKIWNFYFFWHCAITDCKRVEIGHIKLTFWELHLISENCSVTVEIVSNLFKKNTGELVSNVVVNQKSLGEARSKCWTNLYFSSYSSSFPLVFRGRKKLRQYMFFWSSINHEPSNNNPWDK